MSVLLIDLSCLAAIRATMGRSRELSTEAEYLAWVDLEGRLGGANHLAYPPVIAAGKGLVKSMFFCRGGGCGDRVSQIL